MLHDWLYQSHNYPELPNRNRKEADAIFYEAMLVGGAKKWKAKIMYYGVRLFGALAWH